METCIEEGMEVGNDNCCSSEIEHDTGGDPMDSGKFKNFFLITNETFLH